MRLGFNGATTNTADLATDIRIAGAAGYDVIELRDNKLEAFFANGGSLDEVRQMLQEMLACRKRTGPTSASP